MMSRQQSYAIGFKRKIAEQRQLDKSTNEIVKEYSLAKSTIECLY
jgi:hypothetical protein